VNPAADAPIDPWLPWVALALVLGALFIWGFWHVIVRLARHDAEEEHARWVAEGNIERRRSHR
jgi:hypothetical protein